MGATPLTAFVMRSNATACRETAAALGRLGFAVAEFSDGTHLYGHAIRVAAALGGDARRSFVILAEPTGDVVKSLEMLRSGNWPTPLVLVGPEASPETAERLRAVCLAAELPTAQELRRAIDRALTVCVRN